MCVCQSICMCAACVRVAHLYVCPSASVVCGCAVVSQASLFFYEGARAEGGGKKSLVT